MKFYGKGGVWDRENSKMLCRFADGCLITEDSRIIKILTGLGYKSDPVPKAKTKAPIKRKVKK